MIAIAKVNDKRILDEFTEKFSSKMTIVQKMDIQASNNSHFLKLFQNLSRFGTNLGRDYPTFLQNLDNPCGFIVSNTKMSLE